VYPDRSQRLEPNCFCLVVPRFATSFEHEHRCAEHEHEPGSARVPGSSTTVGTELFLSCCSSLYDVIRARAPLR
jgi:hypothetical protein